MFWPLIIFLVIAVIVSLSAIKVIPQSERGVIFRFGRAMPEAKGPGIIVLAPFADILRRINVEETTLELPEQNIITMDNKVVNIHARIRYRVFDPVKALSEVDDYSAAIPQLSRTVLLKFAQSTNSSDLNSNSGEMNASLTQALNSQANSWGITVSSFEITGIR